MALLNDDQKEQAAPPSAAAVAGGAAEPSSSVAAASASATAIDTPPAATNTTAAAGAADSPTATTNPPSSLSAVVQRLFRGTVCLAPMVRAGTLPFRLLCLGFGADVVWGEEIIDRKLLDCERRVNERLGTVDFVSRKDGRLIFATTAAERDRVIFQMGASPRNPEWAVRAASLVAGDVAGIDVNMGCPKKFSMQDGMGAALLQNEAGAAALIRALRAALPPHVPVTCKIRLLDSPERTLAFARAMQAAGCAAIGVHMRTKRDRATDPARWDSLAPLVQGLDIPVIANGDIYTRGHLEAVRAAAGDRGLSVMLARPALYNPSVFRALKGEGKEQQLATLDEAMRTFVRLCCRFDNHVSNSKYTIMEMMCRKRHPEHLRAELPLELPPGKDIQVVSRVKTGAALAALWDLDPEAEGPQSGEGTQGEARLGLHLCSDAYFAEELEEGKKEKRGEKRARLSGDGGGEEGEEDGTAKRPRSGGGEEEDS